jgi:rhamnosyltransferase
MIYARPTRVFRRAVSVHAPPLSQSIGPHRINPQNGALALQIAELEVATERMDYEAECFLSRAAIVIPTYNAARHWPDLHRGLELQGVSRDQVLVIDSSSTDNTRQLVRAAGYRLQRIPSASFRHGTTRQMAAEHCGDAEFLVYLTQDAVAARPNCIEDLLSAFRDPTVGAAYGRQVPRKGSCPIEYHARRFNYPDRSEVRDFESRKHLGIRAAFFSNSFAAYRNTAFKQVGGFPCNTIVSEEISVVAQMLMAGWKVAYEAKAEVVHSHRFSLREESSRYFDIGVHHHRERQIMDHFGRAEGEGIAFVKSELNYLWNVRRRSIPLACLRNLNKWVSYHLGRNERMLPLSFKRALSAQSNFWTDEVPWSRAKTSWAGFRGLRRADDGSKTALRNDNVTEAAGQ